jgi:hypothetical protein
MTVWNDNVLDARKIEEKVVCEKDRLSQCVKKDRRSEGEEQRAKSSWSSMVREEN